MKPTVKIAPNPDTHSSGGGYVLFGIIGNAALLASDLQAESPAVPLICVVLELPVSPEAIPLRRSPLIRKLMRRDYVRSRHFWRLRFWRQWFGVRSRQWLGFRLFVQ